jgi:protein-L-isoaspartate(D-aspartate) O-methyltransferase
MDRPAARRHPRRSATRIAGACVACAVAWLGPLASAQDFAAARRGMLAAIEQLTEETARETGRPTLDPRVLAALGKVERHLFVPPAQQRYAYENRPLPIGHGQTISQPYIVALMTDLARVAASDVVLEIGTGSGYQAAVLAELARSVYSIEIIEPLGASARERLARLGYRSVAVKVADGYYGWPEHGPFDAILVTAAASHVPPPLVRQLKPGGRMVIPVGTAFLTQHLMLVEKQRDGSVVSRQVLPVRFVPLSGGH